MNLATFTIEAKIYNMHFHACKEFEITHGNVAAKFTVLTEYFKWMIGSSTDRSPWATGKVTSKVEAVDIDGAIALNDVFLNSVEHLLTLAHQHHVFTMDVSCYDAAHNWLKTRGFSGRMGETAAGSLLWGTHLKEFLDIALPRLDTIPAFRWGLYLFNELTAISTHVAQMQIPSLWTVLEFSAYTFALEREKDELLSDEEVEKLRKPIKQALIDLGYGDNGKGEEEKRRDRTKRSEVYKQLGQLKHRPIMELVNELLAEYSLSEYLNETQDFYLLRNNIAHGRNIQLSSVDFVSKIARFERLLQKLLFSMAGIYGRNDFFKAPITNTDLSAN
jgi:hypothetical protein